MPSLRDDITRTLVRIGRRFQRDASSHPAHYSNATGSLREGTQTGPYRVIRKLGAGGMGQVYLGHDNRLGRQVALKVLPPELTTEPLFLQRFQQEARTASALNHPNILTIYDFVEIEGTQIIVSEFVAGATLRAALERNTIDLSAALDVTAQIASALVAAHSAGVVHRDLKPTNIMIRHDGYVKVIDFGLAKLAERSSDKSVFDRTLTRPGRVVGTIGYMSPEQARGDEVDHRTDLWSLGVVLYEMVTGYPPFEGSSHHHVIVSILDDPPRPIANESVIASGLAKVISRALVKNRKERYQSAAELLSDIQTIQQTRGTQVTVRLDRRPRPSRNTWTFVIAAIMLFLGVAALWWWPAGGRWKVLGPSWFELAQTERLTYEGNVSRATISPDGAWLAYTVAAGGHEVLRLRDLATRAERSLTPSDQAYSGLTFSPDSKTLFFVLRDPKRELGVLFSIAVGEFGPRKPAATVLQDVDGPICFSPDGKSFAFLRRAEVEVGTTDTGSIYVAPVSNTHEARSIVSMREAQISPQLSWSTRGIAAVLYPSRLGKPTQATISIYKPDGTLQLQYTPPQLRAIRSPVFLPNRDCLLFAALTQGAEQWRLKELSLATGAVHDISSDLAGFDDISRTADATKVAAVRFTSHSAVWVVDARTPSMPARLSPDTEYYSSLAWTNDDRILVPSSRMGNVNLMRLALDGQMTPLLHSSTAVEISPATLVGSDAVVYSSNAAHGGDDFNIWRMDSKSGRPPVPLTSGSNLDLTPDISSDGHWVVYVSSVSGAPSLWKVPLAGGTPEPVSHLRARKPYISPDGRSILCEVRAATAEWRVAILSAADGSVVRELPTLPIGGLVRWSPDGLALDYVAEKDGRSGIWRLLLTGGPPKLIAEASEDKIVFFAWSQNGSKLAYVRGRAESDVALMQP